MLADYKDRRGDFSDRSSSAKPCRIPITELLGYIEEARAMARRKPPKRFRTPKNEMGLKFEESSLSTTRVRQRLCDLMGTDVIRLNDKRYFQKLSEKLQEEYDTAMDKHEESRAAREEQRLRRLMLEGIIDAPNDYRAIIHGEHKSMNKKKKKKKSKRMSAHATAEGSTVGTSVVSDDEGEKKAEVVTQVEIMSNSSKPSSPTRAGNRSVTPSRRPPSRQEDKKTEMHARPPHHETALRSSSSCSIHRKSRRVKSAHVKGTSWAKETESDESDNEPANDKHYETQSLPDRTHMRTPSKYSKQEPEMVKQLRTEQTVAGLYSLAEELVSPVSAADDLRDRKVKLAN